jgi:hypothetical protein
MWFDVCATGFKEWAEAERGREGEGREEEREGQERELC